VDRVEIAGGAGIAHEIGPMHPKALRWEFVADLGVR
jgi:hypothetical protein